MLKGAALLAPAQAGMYPTTETLASTKNVHHFRRRRGIAYTPIPFTLYTLYLYPTPNLSAQAGVHPEQPGCTLSRPEFDRVWEHSVLLMQRGFQSGSILTVDPEEAAVLGPPWERRHASAFHTIS